MRKGLLVVVLALLVALPGVAQEKRRVAVLDFGYGTVLTSVEAIFGSNQDVGKGISDLLDQSTCQRWQLSCDRAQRDRQDSQRAKFLQQRSGQHRDCRQNRWSAWRGHDHHRRCYPIRPG